MKKLKKIIPLVIIVIVIAIGCVVFFLPKSQANRLAKEVRQNLIEELAEQEIGEYTIADSVIQEAYHDFYLIIDIPSLEAMDDQSKLLLLEDLCDQSEGFYMNYSGNSSDWSMVFVRVTSQGNEYSAYDRYVYYKNGETVVVNNRPSDDGGNYDKNDPYYSSNDYNKDGYLDLGEFQGAVGDYMDDHGY